MKKFPEYNTEEYEKLKELAQASDALCSAIKAVDACYQTGNVELISCALLNLNARFLAWSLLAIDKKEEE